MAKKKGAYVMGGPKGAPKAAAGTGLAAAQHQLGLVQNAQGQWVRPGAALATKYMTAVATNLGYQGNALGGSTPLANRRGERIGFIGGEPGSPSFTLAGGKGKGNTRKTGPMGKKHKKGHVIAGTTMDEITNTALENTTALGKAYGKTNYRTAQFSPGASLPEFGKSGTGKKPQAETRRGRTRQLAKKNKKK